MSISKRFGTIFIKDANIKSHMMISQKVDEHILHVPFATLDSGIGASKGYGDSKMIKEINKYIKEKYDGEQKFELHIANFPRIKNKID